MTNQFGTGKWRNKSRGLRGLLVAGLVASVGVVISAASPVSVLAIPTGDDYLDNFDAASYDYTNSNGTIDWSPSPWVEANDGGSPSTGNIEVVGQQLEFSDLDSDDSISRSVNLDPATMGASKSVLLTFEYASENGGGESLSADLWNQSAGAWEEVAILSTSGGEHPTLPYTVTVQLSEDQISASSALRFSSDSGGWNSDDEVRIDNVKFSIGDLTANPDLDPGCGIDVMVILDESGSIGGPENEPNYSPNVESAVRNLSDALANTTSQLSIVEFSNNSRLANIGGATGYRTPATPDTDLETYLTGPGVAEDAVAYNPASGDEWYTNWEAALDVANTNLGAGKLVVFLTDGLPNTVGTAGTSGNENGPGEGAASAGAAIDEIEAIKATGAHVLAIGVGGASVQANFDLLARTVEPNGAQIWVNNASYPPEPDLRTVDAIRVNDFATLGQSLRKVAFALCSPSVTITKVNETGSVEPLWDFTGEVDIAAPDGETDQYQWITPSIPNPSAPIADDGTGLDIPQTQQTGAAGEAVTYQWVPNSVDSPKVWNSTFTFTETLPTGWTRTETPVCSVSRLLVNGTYTEFDMNPSVSQEGQKQIFTIDPLLKGDIVSCTVENIRPGAVRIAKTGQGTATDFDFKVNSATANATVALGSISDPIYFAAGTEVTIEELAETGTPPWNLTSLSCSDNTESATSSVTVTVLAGETITCTFNNVQDASLVIDKIGSPSDDETPFSFEITDAQNTIGVGPLTIAGSASLPQALTPGTYTVTETTSLPGWNLAGIDCGANEITDSEDLGAQSVQVLVAPGDQVTCTFTNDELGSIKVVKKATPSGTFDFTLDGPDAFSDTKAVASGATGYTWTSLGAGSYSLDEVQLPLYTLLGATCNGAAYTPGDPITLAAGQDITCEFENARIGEVTYDKALTAGPTVQAGTNKYDLTYEVTVVNNSFLDQDVTVVDTLDFPAGTFVVNSVTSSDSSVKVNDGTDGALWDGDGDLTVGAQTIVGRSLQSPTEIVITIDVTVTLPGDTIAGVDCSGEIANRQVGNSADLANDDRLPVDVCTLLPDPNIDMTKTVVGDATRDAAGIWTIVYELTVSNTGDGPGEYDVVDEITFGASAAIDIKSVDAVALPATGQTDPAAPATADIEANFDGEGQNTLVLDAEIVADAVHTYRVTVTAEIVDPSVADGECKTDPVADGGFLNSATLTANGTAKPPVTACDDFSIITLKKVLISDSGGNAAIGDFTLTATPSGESDAVVSGTDGVTEAIEAGSYVLAETDVDGYTASDWVCTNADPLAGDTVTVVDGASVTCTITNDDEPVDLELTKFDGGITAIAGGDAFDYTITVANIGTRDMDIEPVELTDELPAGLVWVSYPGTCTQAGQTLTCDIDPTLLPAGGDPVVIVATVRALANAASGTYVNHASVTTQDDPVCEGEECTPPPCSNPDAVAANNNVDCEETPLNREGGIQIVKTDDVAGSDSVQRGENFTYDLVVTNLGPATILPGLAVDDDLPAQLSLVSVSGGTGWSCNNTDPIECTYAPGLAPGASAPAITVTVSVNAGAAGDSIENTAVVTAAVDRECPLDSERLTENHFVAACNQVTDSDDEVTPLAAITDLAIVKSASQGQIAPGGQFTWILDVVNNGPSVAANVVVIDDVPTSATVSAVSSSDFACSRVGNKVTCTKASMAVNETGQIRIDMVDATDPGGGSIVNVGTVETDTPETDLSNNSDDARVFLPVSAPPPPTTTTTTTTTTVAVEVLVREVLPPTGSSTTKTGTMFGVLLLGFGAAILLATRRRRDDGADLSAS